MAFTLKPDMLKTAKKAADVQTKAKADLKSCAGKTGVKFIAAKWVKIGGKTVNLFIVTDTPKAFETVLSTKYTDATRASGTCDVTKDKKAGTFQVMIKTATGPLPAPLIAKLVKDAVLSDKSIVASYEKAPITAPQSRPELNQVEQPKDQGVPDWAKKKYVEKAGRTVIASMTSDGKIGSVYFEDDGRIRTTHRSGPTRSQHDDKNTLQFNIDRELAQAEFEKANPESTDPKDYPRWVSNELTKGKVDKNGIVQNVPSWAKQVTGPSTAHDLDTGQVTENAQLFEVFTSINGDVQGWHPSRGAAVKFETDKQTISVLHAAIEHINKLHPLESDKDEKHPVIAKRRQEIVQLIKTQRANPDENLLKDLRNDQVIAQRIQELKLVEPSITDLDKDKVIRDQLNKLFTGTRDRMFKEDPTIKKQMQALRRVKRLRNQAFYDFVKSRLPKSEIFKAMRDPKTI